MIFGLPFSEIELYCGAIHSSCLPQSNNLLSTPYHLEGVSEGSVIFTFYVTLKKKDCNVLHILKMLS